MSALLSIQGVTLVRGGRLLFDGLDLELESGDALQLLGPNGSGKSSLIRLAAGLLQPRLGTIQRAELALADDAPALDRELSLKHALNFWCASPEKALEEVGLAHLSDVPVRLLSSGQIKRAILARVAASKAPLWLLDEPLNALDSEGLERVGNLIERHRQAGGAVLAASHSALPGRWQSMEIKPCS